MRVSPEASLWLRRLGETYKGFSRLLKNQLRIRNLVA
jgi:hypothetical protein